MSNANFSKIFEFSDVTPRVKEHLNKVYGSLAIACAAATTTCMFTPEAVVMNIGFVIVSIVATIGLILYMMSKRGNHSHDIKLACLVGIAAIDGACIKPLVSRANEIDETLVMSALLHTAVIFISFSLASLMTRRRSMLFLGSILSSVLMGMFAASFFSMIFGVSFISYMAYNIIMVIVFSLYVIYDTQMIVEKAHNGDYDYNLHALDLFIDLIRIFVHILKILMEKSEKKRRD